MIICVCGMLCWSIVYLGNWYKNSNWRVLAGRNIFKVAGSNLFVLADRRLKGYDPETINYTTTAYGSQPLPTSFTLGLNVNF
ncbi:MAG: hypothetical protein ACLTZT_08545 [Butyricimonas faecalis]